MLQKKSKLRNRLKILFSNNSNISDCDCIIKKYIFIKKNLNVLINLYFVDLYNENPIFLNDLFVKGQKIDAVAITDIRIV